MESIVRDPSLAPQGRQKIDWAKQHMAVLRSIAEEFQRDQPFRGLRIVICIHLEAKTAYLAEVLHLGGAEVYATGSNPLSTQDDVCAALAESGVTVLATHGCNMEDFHRYECLALSTLPDVMIDDGGDLVHILHEEHPEWAVNLRGGCEETTTGILRLQSRARAGKLNFPMFNVNDADCKHLFDNRYGTGQSVWDGIMRTTNLVVAGSTAVVGGYGWCGKGVAMRAKGLGAKVIVTEVAPVKAIEAVMDGFSVMPMEKAAELGDFFVTVTGCDGVITPEHMLRMKNGAVLCNAGHFDVEVDVAGLRALATQRFEARKNIEGYLLPNGKTVYLLGEGRLVNLAAGDGHPVEIMDMSFALQAQCARRIAEAGKNLAREVFSVPADIDQNVALKKLTALGVTIDTLTPEQERYLHG
ncbi:MAG TPA: adenosylhomocysteinase [Candidatus Limiplasma sp.]|nr:adenosylhomocysteinase [Candidatus Limiplasma sp.]HPS81709.1 adenosylhomocysteinase [Candidatus Limiplasma sp.]